MGDAQPPDTSSLPISPHRLIGREGERAAARTYLLEDAVPLLTLAGPGGVGKTRLALAIAADLATHFRDGAVWVDLAPIGDASLVPATVAAALGITLAPDRPSESELARRLRPRQTLLLLDNCEHLAAAVAGLAAHLLAYCPALQILATSRAPLHLRGEQLFPVEPLPLPEVATAVPEELSQNASVRLFIERARALRPAFALTASNASAVAALCRQLDGLPLAIELAAARSATHTPEELLAQMTNRMLLLRDGPRDLPTRQQTIRNTIAWSYALLSPAEQSLFRRAAVFVGGFTVEAAAAVSGVGKTLRDVRSAIDQVVDQNLVRQMEILGVSRFTMLETIREFGLERLEEAGERGAAQDAHAAYFVRHAEDRYRYAAEDAEGSQARLLSERGEQANFRAALTHLAATGAVDDALQLTAALSGFWHAQMNLRESRQWLEWTLANTTETPTAARGLAWSGLAWSLWTLAQHDEAQRAAEAGLAIAEQLNDREVRAGAVEILGGIALSLHQYERAKPLLEEAIGLQRQLGQQTAVASSLQVLAGIEHGLGDDESAERHALEALVISRDLENQIIIAVTLARLGRLVRDQGNDRAAALAYREGLEICASAGDRFSIVQQFAGLGEIASRRGQAEIAAVLLGVVDQIAEQAGAKRLPTAGVNYDRATAATREALGEERFAALRAAGRRLPIDKAVHLARSIAIPAALPGVPDPPWLALQADTEATVATLENDQFAGLVGMNAAPRLTIGALLPTPIAAPDLTYREQDVLALLCERQTDAEIAERLFISPRTVASHVSNILAKLGAVNRREAAAIAARQGLLGT